MLFPVSGVEINPIIPFAVAFTISFFSSMGGVSGAFLLLPFQVSVLGFMSPSVSATNHVFNLIAIPSGVYRYIKEGRMAWPIAWVIILGTLPGVLIGTILRIKYLPDPDKFKLFIGVVLFYIGIRLLVDLTLKGNVNKAKTTAFEESFKQRSLNHRRLQGRENKEKVLIRTVSFSISKYTFEFYNELFSFNTTYLFLLSLIVGVVGGTYGIGGGAIIAPFLIAIFRLPVYTIAGAALLGTFVTSFVGVIFYTIITPIYSSTGLSIGPDWKLGFIFGVGGFLGIYLGARFQKYFPAKVIKFILGAIVLILSIRYIVGFFI